jgi:hypothetical protein
LNAATIYEVLPGQNGSGSPVLTPTPNQSPTS